MYIFIQTMHSSEETATVILSHNKPRKFPVVE